MDRNSDAFISLFSRSQTAVYAYIRSLVDDREQAQELLQETNLTAWRKAEQFQDGTSFTAWACKIGYFHVMAYRRRVGRSKVIFNDELVDFLAERHAERMEPPAVEEVAARALRSCLDALPDRQREMIESRYRPDGGVARLAETSGRSAASISVTLSRIRSALQQCVRRKLSSDR